MRRAGATLAALALIAVGACSREPATDTATTSGSSTVGAKIDRALDRTQQKLATAGEKAKEDLAEATEKTQATLSRAGEKIATTTTTVTTGPATSASASGIPQDTRAALNDAAITASIKADFIKDPDLSVLKIDVDTRDGVVTLNGLADNDAARTRAERMAQSVKGVREVRNYLTAKRG